MSLKHIWPIAGLFSGALTWGLIWYPARILQGAGITGELLTFVTYFIPLCLGLVFFGKSLSHARRHPWILLLIGLSAGWANLAYVLGVIHGEVMRVLLLFYLAPVWTLLLARFFLREKPRLLGYIIMLVSLCGALLILWKKNAGFPLPQNGAEWLGLSAGIMFAVSNVAARAAPEIDIFAKSLSVWAGVSLLALLVLLYQPAIAGTWYPVATGIWIWLVIIAALMFLVTLAVQFGLAHIPANQAIIIFLSELVVGAISSYYLAGETLGLREWIGGAMILSATLFSGRLNKP